MKKEKFDEIKDAAHALNTLASGLEDTAIACNLFGDETQEWSKFWDELRIGILPEHTPHDIADSLLPFQILVNCSKSRLILPRRWDGTQKIMCGMLV